MSKKCCHGVKVDLLNCLICNPEKKNICKCNNNGTCELCKVFKPLKSDIDNCLREMCKKQNINCENLLK